ncbi:uncharacterized protein LAJ45_10745 [Morchella importuna]|uniref:uncharacterized protein n=1 Tax=Morchella importuna TaxID=1174673 RepID=UPI001E8E7385|nr:uncharacterized protein LAJ45_10745 [Morchella importuna]KAH8145185.1 hypothetical protein LAJ45_10745 [Morchella importuna]
MATNLPIDYQQLSHALQAFFQEHPEVDGNVGIEAYALLQRAQHGLAQYATDLQEVEREAGNAREMFERDLAAARGHRVAVEVVAPDEEPIGDDNAPPVPPVPPVPVVTQQSEKLPDPEGFAANQFLQYVGEEGIALPSMLRFYEILDTAFGDPDRMRTARRNLRNIRQRNRTFADYFAEFQRYAAESGMDEVSRIEALMEGINAELDESMIHHKTPATVDACATLLQRLDN